MILTDRQQRILAALQYLNDLRHNRDLIPGVGPYTLARLAGNYPHHIMSETDVHASLLVLIEMDYARISWGRYDITDKGRAALLDIARQEGYAA